MVNIHIPKTKSTHLNKIMILINNNNMKINILHRFINKNLLIIVIKTLYKIVKKLMIYIVNIVIMLRTIATNRNKKEKKLKILLLLIQIKKSHKIIMIKLL